MNSGLYIPSYGLGSVLCIEVTVPSHDSGWLCYVFVCQGNQFRSISTIFLLDFETVIFLFIKKLLDNVLSIVVELWVSLQV